MTIGFKLYFAGEGISPKNEYRMMELGCLRLLSYWLHKDRIELYREKGLPLFLDSGAYTAHTQGAKPNVDDYISYINERDEFLTCYAQLDTIPGDFGKPKTKQQLAEAPELSWKNYLYMVERVKTPSKLLPIFHQGEDFSHLDRILNFEPLIEYIGISPANDLPVQQKAKWIEEVFKIIGRSKNPHVKTHAFGMTSLYLLEMYPFYSADSTSWLMTGSMGSIMTKFGTILVSKSKSSDRQHYSQLPKHDQDQLVAYVESYGFNLEDLSTDYKARMLFNVHYLKDWAKNYQHRPKKVAQGKLF